MPEQHKEICPAEYGIEEEAATNTECDSLHLRLAVQHDTDEVFVGFCKPISYMYLTPEQAVEYADLIKRAANIVLERQRAAAPIQ